jgi:Xaa-Pro aminopeptidase
MTAMTATGSHTDIAHQLERRRRDAAASWDLRNELVLIGAGSAIPVPGRGDRTYRFRAHSEYLYLTDRERPGGVLAFDPQDGWSDFVVPVGRDEIVWEGADPAEATGTPIGELDAWLARRQGRPIAGLGSQLIGLTSEPELTGRLRRGLNAVRRAKDLVELERMRTAMRATAAGLAAVRRLLEPGRTERELQIELEAEFFRHGADELAFDTIVASGPNSAVLHFPPTPRALQPAELVLIDTGAEYRAYDSDITRTYPVAGELTGAQADLHALVHRACTTAVALCTAGTEYVDIHRVAALTIAEGLADLGFLRGPAEDLVATGAVSLFFPHGVGHMVGLGVRDASEVLPGRRPDPEIFPNLRMDLPLELGYTLTIEPGVYFIPALLRDPGLRERHRDAVAWDRAEAMLDFGGIRIEENVLVREDGPEVLSREIPVL